MTIGWPRSRDISSPTVRVSVSPVPPTANGTTILMGLAGNACGHAAHDSAASNAPNAAMRRGFMYPPSDFDSNVARAPEPEIPHLALKTDVDTYRGTRVGVPRLVEMLKRHDAGAT